jgi:nucleotide-binding universal stress UspA family protein
MASEAQHVDRPWFLTDLQAAVDEIVVGQWPGDKAWDYAIEVKADGSISIKATANQTIFMDTVYHSVAFVQDEGCLTLEGDPDTSIRAEFDEFHVVGTFQQIGAEIERNYRAIHETLATVAKRHGLPFSEGPLIIRKGGVRVAEEAMLAKISDAVLLAEIERRGLLSETRGA